MDGAGLRFTSAFKIVVREFALAMFLAFEPLTFVYASTRVVLLAVAVRLTIFEHADVAVTIGVQEAALAIHSAVQPVALV